MDFEGFEYGGKGSLRHAQNCLLLKQVIVAMINMLGESFSLLTMDNYQRVCKSSSRSGSSS